MKVQIRGFYSDGSNGHDGGDVLFERETVIGGDSDDDTDRILEQVWAAKEALEKSQVTHSVYLVVLEPDEA